MSYNCFSKYYMDERLKVKSKRCFFLAMTSLDFLNYTQNTQYVLV